VQTKCTNKVTLCDNSVNSCVIFMVFSVTFHWECCCQQWSQVILKMDNPYLFFMEYFSAYVK